MSSAICFNLDQSKILSSGNGLKDKEITHSFNVENDGTPRMIKLDLLAVSDSVDQDQTAYKYIARTLIYTVRYGFFFFFVQFHL